MAIETLPNRRERRGFLRGAAAAGAGLLLASARDIALAKPTPRAEAAEEEVSPASYLKREHGVLRRLLLVYGEAIRRLDAREELRPEPIAHAAEIIRAFIEDYHERDEEQYIFPRFQKAGKLVDLVATLLAQHQAGRKLTAEIAKLATPSGLAR